MYVYCEFQIILRSICFYLNVLILHLFPVFLWTTLLDLNDNDNLINPYLFFPLLQ